MGSDHEPSGVLPVGVMPIRTAAPCTATALTALGMFGEADPSGTYLAGGRGVLGPAWWSWGNRTATLTR